MKDITLLRNREFTRRCIEIYRRDIAEGVPPTIDSILERAMALQPRSHYVAYDTAAKRLHAIMKRGMENVVASKLAREMWQEILDQVHNTMATRNCKSFDRALSFVINFGRPSRFYITPDTARRIIIDFFTPSVTLRKEMTNRC